MEEDIDTPQREMIQYMMKKKRMFYHRKVVVESTGWSIGVDEEGRAALLVAGNLDGGGVFYAPWRELAPFGGRFILQTREAIISGEKYMIKVRCLPFVEKPPGAGR